MKHFVGYCLAGMVIFLLFTTCTKKTTEPEEEAGEGAIEWEKTFGGGFSEEGYSVQQTSDGGYIVAGVSYSSENMDDAYLIKTDGTGNSQWTKTYGGPSTDYGRSVQQTNDGGYIITGQKHSSGNYYDVYLIKTDESGSTAWSKTYGGSDGDWGWSVQQTNDGGYIVAGFTESFGSGELDVYLIRTNENGDTLWTETYGGSGMEYSKSVDQTNDGGYIVAGYADLSGAEDYDVYLIKTDANGNCQWTKTYGGTAWDKGFSVKQTSDGGYIVAGWTASYGSGSCDVYLIKTDENGNSQWTKTYGGTDDDKGYSVCETSDGGYIVAGYTKSSGNGSADIYLIKTDANGNSKWSKTYGGSEYDECNSLQQTSDGGYILVGMTCSFGSYPGDVYLIKIKP